MPEYIMDAKTHLIYVKPIKKSDSFYTALSEGRILSYLNIKYPVRLRHGIRILEEISAFLYRRRMMKHIPVIKNRIVFSTFQGSHTCNCKYLAEAMLERYPDHELIFLVEPSVYHNRESYDIPQNVYLVCKETQAAYFALASAQIWVDNALTCIWKIIPKKKGQIYVNTWHGSLGIKRLSGSSFWKIIARYANYVTDYFLTDSIYDEQVFHDSFWPRVKPMKIGHPRNDLFFQKDRITALRKKVLSYYNIPENTKVVLYAPTFRDREEDIQAIHLSFPALTDALERKFGGSWMILCRLHHRNAENELFKQELIQSPNVIDASDYLDIQELLAASDVGITDYSSWIFDYLFTGRPAFIYATDIEKYRNSRGFYYSLSDTPFSIADSDESLAKNIAAFDSSYYIDRVKTFLEEKG